MRISVSKAGTFSECPRRYYYAYDLELAPKQRAAALDLGTLVHEGLEYYYRTGNTYRVEDAGEIGDKARAALDTYSIFGKMNDHFEVVDLERDFTLPLEGAGREVTFEGRIDAVVRLDGGLYLMEHKTCSQHWGVERLVTSPQHVLYELAAEELYKEPVRGTLYNFLRLTRRGGQHHCDIKRVTVPSNPHARIAHYDDLLSKISLFNTPARPRNSGQHCSYCSFFVLCQSDLLGGDTPAAIQEFFVSKESK